MQVQILGSSAGGPFQGRHYTAQILQQDNHYYLIDCGEGTQEQMYKFGVKADRLNHVFISHLHGDHVYGLVGLITSYCLKRRTETLHCYAPAGLQELVAQTFRLTGVRTPFPMVFHVVDTEQSSLVFENRGLEVWSIPLNHRTPCAGWLFREKPRLRNIRKEKIEEYNLHYSQLPALKRGEHLLLPDGRNIPNAELTQDPPAPQQYAFCSDTAFSEKVVELVKGVDLLYHEATFTNDHQEEAAIAYHSTAEQAATVALRAGVGRLIMGHFSARYKNLEQHLSEARAVFSASDVVVEGEWYGC